MSSEVLTPGTRVGRYEVVAHLASGGMGEVYKARDIQLDRIVALKVLPPRLSENTSSVERFRREARAAAKLSHKNIVTLYDWGLDGATWFLALEFIDGVDLNAYIGKKGRLDPQEAWLITIQAARALDHAFQQGVTHRDVKPSNFLLLRQGGRLRVKLTDLGVARALTDETEGRVTRAGTTVGTLDYLAPEQARDSAMADVRSDIYSLGCTLYHMLAGQPPFPEGGLGERLFKHLQVDPPDVRDFNPDVPYGLWDVMRRMLAKRPDDRYQTPAELLEALLSLQEGGPASSVRRGTNAADTAAPGPPSTPETIPLPQGGPYAGPTTAPRARAPDITSLEGLGVTAEQRHMAAAQFERAREVLASDHQEKGYAYQLLVSCCKLDPANTAYRSQLRQLGQELYHREGLGRWLSPLTSLLDRTRLKAARHGGDHRKVLECGEAVLARAPEDAATHLAMADAAAGLNLPYLEIWMLEQARKEVADRQDLLRRLADAYERLNELDRAIQVWEAVRKHHPQDADAPRKINALSAQSTIARGKYDS
jgi:hypothetical protein